MAGAIEELLHRYVSTAPDPETPEPERIRTIAAKIGALPLVTDMGGLYALRPDGEIISVAWDDDEPPRSERDPRIRNAMLFQGSKRYPELAALVPNRPEQAIDCPHCSGTGVVRIEGHEPEEIPSLICYCGGLGWIPA